MLYLVSGCSVSVVCEKEKVMYWVDEIVQRGGVPAVQPLLDWEAA